MFCEKIHPFMMMTSTSPLSVPPLSDSNEPTTDSLILFSDRSSIVESVPRLSFMDDQHTTIYLYQIRVDNPKNTVMIHFGLEPYTTLDRMVYDYWVSYCTTYTPDGQFDFFNIPYHYHVPVVRLVWKAKQLYPMIFSRHTR